MTMRRGNYRCVEGAVVLAGRGKHNAYDPRVLKLVMTSKDVLEKVDLIFHLNDGFIRIGAVPLIRCIPTK